MLSAIKLFLGDMWQKILLYGTMAIAGIFLLFQLVLHFKKAGRKEAESEMRERTLTNVEKANAARREVETASDIPDSVRKFYHD